MPQSKATKKFEKRHLKDTLQRRKEVAKIKQKKQVKDKQKARRAKEQEREEAEKPKASANGRPDAAEQFKDMTVDEFFQGGFEIPEKATKKTSKTTGKRKRTPVEDDEDSASSSEEDTQAFPADDDAPSDAGSDEEGGDHKLQLEELAKKDPEFYKYMKENDPELLDFEDADLDNLVLSDDDEEMPKKKRKTAKGEASDSEDEDDSSEVTKAMISKWEKAMTEQRSLNALRQVVLAFRAAAHLNEETGKSYKYRVSNPDGKSSSMNCGMITDKM